MLIRSATVVASVVASLFGASQADAGYFGHRNGCGTSSACAPCPSVPATSPWVTQVSQPVGGVGSGGLDPAAYGIQLAPGERLVSPPVALRSKVSGEDDVLRQIQQRVDTIDQKLDELLN